MPLPLDMSTATNPGVDPLSAGAPIGLPRLHGQVAGGRHSGQMKAHVKGGPKRGRAYKASSRKRPHKRF